MPKYKQIATGQYVDAPVSPGVGYALVYENAPAPAPAPAPAESGAPAHVPGWTPAQATTPEIDARLKAIQLNQAGLQKFRDEALRTGPSAWAGLAGRNVNQQSEQTLDQLQRQGFGANATARAELAMRGGLTGGARERLARAGARDQSDVAQQVFQNRNTNLFNIASQDEKNRIAQLQALPGMELQAIEPDFRKVGLFGQASQFDVGQRSQEAQNLNAYNASNYAALMANQANARTADAMQEQANRNNGLFGLGGSILTMGL